MLRDANELDDGAVVTADVCVAGGGAAGITVADALRESGLSVCLLESGGVGFDAETQDLAEGEMTGRGSWDPAEMRLRQLGGSTGHWSGWCVPLAPEDFEVREWIAPIGWPIDREELLPYYERAQSRLHLGGFVYDAATLSDRTGRPLIEAPEGRLTTGVFQFSRPPVRFGDEYRDVLTSARDVATYLHANLVDIHLTPGLDRVSRFDCRTLSDVSFSIEAGRFVLALGGLENARLLLASGAQRESHFGDGFNHVGRYFMEHPHFYSSAAWIAPADADLTFYDEQIVNIPIDGEPRHVPVRGFLTLSRAVREAEGLPQVGVTFSESSVEDTRTGALDPTVVRTLTRGAGGERVFRMTARAEQRPDPASRVTLGDESDALGMRRLQLDWRVLEEDLRDIRRTLAIVGAELASAGLGRLWTSAEGRAIGGRIDPGGHHMGTTRMAQSPEGGVVDGDCRVFGIDNLYVAGSSVFPTVGLANPTLTIVALAERLAGHLRDGT